MRSFQLKIGLFLFFVIVLFSIFGPLMSSNTYFDIDFSIKNQPPSYAHWFGTDDLGRDLFTRVWIGARLSLFIGLAAAFIDLIIGVCWGCFAALSSRAVDGVMMRIVDILYALPYLLVVILMMVILEPGLPSLLVSMTIFGWMTMARIVRGQVLQLKEMEYVLASKALGAGMRQILWVHILPNAKSSILTTLALTIPQAIFTEAFLSFMGLGIQAPMSSWGTMANEGLPALAYYPWRLFFPGCCIILTMLSFNLIGERIGDEQ